MMIMIGDTFHNFVDGILIAAAFMANVELGVVTALAIIAHEVPQEVGDFLILLHSGFTRVQALAFNMLSSAAMIAGGVLAYATLQTMERWIPALLGLAAASMLYVSVADLIREVENKLATSIGTVYVGDLLAIADVVLGNKVPRRGGARKQLAQHFVSPSDAPV